MERIINLFPNSVWVTHTLDALRPETRCRASGYFALKQSLEVQDKEAIVNTFGVN